MTNYKTTVGNVEIISLTDGQGGGSPTSIFPESTLQEWREYPNLMEGKLCFLQVPLCSPRNLKSSKILPS